MISAYPFDIILRRTRSEVANVSLAGVLTLKLDDSFTPFHNSPFTKNASSSSSITYTTLNQI